MEIVKNEINHLKIESVHCDINFNCNFLSENFSL